MSTLLSKFNIVLIAMEIQMQIKRISSELISAFVFVSPLVRFSYNSLKCFTWYERWHSHWANCYFAHLTSWKVLDSNKAHVTRWPSSGCLSSGHLLPAFHRAHSKHVSQYCNYQLADHLYISWRILFNKLTLYSEQLQLTQCYTFTLWQKPFHVAASKYAHQNSLFNHTYTVTNVK